MCARELQKNLQIIVKQKQIWFSVYKKKKQYEIYNDRFFNRSIQLKIASAKIIHVAN